MEPTNQSKPAPGSDLEWENTRKRIPGLAEEEVPPTPTPNPVVATPPVKEPVVTEEKKEQQPVVVPPVVVPPKNEDEEDKSSRPLKYIPIKQYTEEKKVWKESKEQYEKRISELEKLAGKADTVQNEQKIKDYAERHGFTFDEAKEQVESLRDILGIEAKQLEEKKPAEFTPEQKQTLERAEEIEAIEYFNTEFSKDAIPQIQELFPNATQEQIERAKKEIEKIACTAPFTDKNLRYVVFESRKELASIFKPKPGSPEVQHKAADKTPVEFKADDFKDGKTSFQELEKMTPESLNKIIREMDTKTYEAYTRYLSSNDKIIINRGGRKIEF